MDFDTDILEWTREPGQYRIDRDKIEIVTMPQTDLWQRTYENWLKGSVEYENDEFQHLGSVVTNHGYSDWATTAIPADVKTMWYRFSRREDDYCIECSTDGLSFTQMRVCHMWEGAGKIKFGIYACSPEQSTFKAVFTDMQITECMWKAHDGQAPDME